MLELIRAFVNRPTGPLDWVGEGEKPTAAYAPCWLKFFLFCPFKVRPFRSSIFARVSSNSEKLGKAVPCTIRASSILRS
jgi:hypothetical protein